jgi:hypothetical protein
VGEGDEEGILPLGSQCGGILSDANNVIPTIELVLIKATELKGKVVNEKGKGVDGVAVVLDLESTPNEKADMSAATGTVDGETGVFVFSDIVWDDPDSVPEVSKPISGNAATTAMRLYIDDNAYYSNANSYRLLDSMAGVSLASGTRTDIRASPIEARSASFSVPLVKGRLVDAGGTGVNGVSVSIDLPITGAGADATVTTGITIPRTTPTSR